MKSLHETILHIDLQKLENNFFSFKKRLNHDCKIICVIKAYAYGHGDVEIAKKLEKLGVDGFWVADFEEGVILRKSGITIPIIIANPSVRIYNEILDYNLDIVIHNDYILQYYLEKPQTINAHIKFNVGMNRYGFDESQIKLIVNKIIDNKNIKIKSICSHLSNSEKGLECQSNIDQLLKFKKISTDFENILGKKVKKHILNSKGIIYFPEHQYDMVRIGMGLYGSNIDNHITPISSFYSVISDIKNINKGDSVGYSSSYISSHDMQIAIVPVGYADGLNRKFGNKVGSVYVSGSECQIIGNISMDSFMIDITNTSCKIGDHVEIFGQNITVNDLANKIDTIPYEIYSTLNRRIKRVYID